MKNIKDLLSLDISWLNTELLETVKKFIALKFSKSPESKKYRKQIARIKTVINSK